MVERLCVPEERESGLEHGHAHSDVARGDADLAFDLSSFRINLGESLLDLQLRQGSVHHQVKQSFLLRGKFLEVSLEIRLYGACGGCLVMDARGEFSVEFCEQLLRKSEMRVEVDDGLLDEGHRQVWQVAAMTLATEALVVGVHVPGLADVLGVHQARGAPHLVAAIAEEHAFEVVAMHPISTSATTPLIENVLYSVEEFDRDERFVLPLELLAFVRDDPEVVLVAEHHAELRPRKGSRWHLRSRSRHETLACEFGMEGIDAVVTRGVQLECHLDEGGPLAVSLHGSDIATGWPNSSSIEVPKWRLAGGASAADLLSHTLLHLTGEVSGVELCDRAHDPVHQHAARRLVDVLGHADELCTGLADRHRDLDVVEAVACEAIDLVDEHEVDLVAQQVGKELLEAGPIGRPR